MKCAFFIVMDFESGDFYSESPVLKRQARQAGRYWYNTSPLAKFAFRFTSFREAVRRAQRLVNKIGGEWHAVLVTDLG
jgi:hypothetical protein